MTFRFLTSTPQDITRGSGTYVGISVLAGALRELGHQVDFESPHRHFPVYTAERLWFNRGLRPSPRYDVTVGYDMDGYRIAGEPGHVASLKGVIADEVRFETGLTSLTMSVQARCDALARGIQVYGRIAPIEESVARYRAVTLDQARAAAACALAGGEALATVGGKLKAAA